MVKIGANVREKYTQSGYCDKRGIIKHLAVIYRRLVGGSSLVLVNDGKPSVLTVNNRYCHVFEAYILWVDLANGHLHIFCRNNITKSCI